MTTLDIGTGLYQKQDFMRMLAEDIERAKAADRRYTVGAVVPQHLPGEGVADLVEIAAGCLRALLRDDDIGGRLDEEVLAMGLPDTDSTEARVVSYRLQGDLRLKSYHLRNTVWEPGMASLGEDGDTAEELLASAIDAAKLRRRRLG
jgi:GGDEF domain-containing protein